jgi:hypothetical protein
MQLRCQVKEVIEYEGPNGQTLFRWQARPDHNDPDTARYLGIPGGGTVQQTGLKEPPPFNTGDQLEVTIQVIPSSASMSSMGRRRSAQSG